VIAITSTGRNMKEAIAVSMSNAGKINFKDKYYRKDITRDLMQYNEQI
jgi:phosphoribosylamine--glycine ligase